jgi:DNA-binding NarL/FixJ family response regulator
VNLLVVSPTQLLCDALRGILAREKGIRVLEQQESFNNVAAVCRADPDSLVLCDGSSTETLRLIAALSRRLSGCRLLVFGVRSRRLFHRYCAGVRIQGLVARNATLKDLVHAIKGVRDHGSFVSAVLQSHSVHANERAPARRLTERERDIASLISRRLTNKQIAGLLRVSEHTVKVHVRHILAKLDARSRSDVASAIMRR